MEALAAEDLFVSRSPFARSCHGVRCRVAIDERDGLTERSMEHRRRETVVPHLYDAPLAARYRRRMACAAAGGGRPGKQEGRAQQGRREQRGQQDATKTHGGLLSMRRPPLLL